MDEQKFNERLGDISTRWTLLQQAHGQSQTAAQRALQELMQQYLGAVYRYLLAAVRDPDAAEELVQEFAMRFISGRFRGASPERGRFRNYVKTCLFHLVDDYQHSRGREPRLLESGYEVPASENAGGMEDQDQLFLESWRSDLLSRCWKRLEEEQERTGKPYFAVLKLRVDHPEMRSATLGETLEKNLGRPFSAAATRQLLHRARERLGELLLEETSISLGTTARDRIEEELAELNLLKYCKPLLESPGE
jgi:DNA-directed RNA polymerase specialized sigma24 family protein